MNIGLFFGSFNPIHIGHLLIAIRAKEMVPFDEVWFVVSPQSPHKNEISLINVEHRIAMINSAIQNLKGIELCTIETKLLSPSYTHLTLKKLQEVYPNNTFNLLIGSDQLEKYDTWVEHDWILQHFKTYVYKRNNYESNKVYQNLHWLDTPIIDISSTEIRERIKENKTIEYFVSKEVESYIKTHQLYITPK